MITALWEGSWLQLEKDDIRAHVDGFYKELFMGQPRTGVSLGPNVWAEGSKVSEEENLSLLAPFSAFRR